MDDDDPRRPDPVRHERDLELQVLRHRIETDPIGAVASLEDAIRHDLSEIREVLFQLDAGSLRSEPVVRDVRARARRALKLPARVTIEATSTPCRPPCSRPRTASWRRRSRPSIRDQGRHREVVASLETLRIEVTDRGRGIAAVTDDDPHFGLRLLRTRVHEIDGSLEIESTPDAASA